MPSTSKRFLAASKSADRAVGMSLQSGLLASPYINDSRMAIAHFRAQSPLPRDAQLLIDETIMKVRDDRLQFVNALLARGLTKPLPNWLAVPTIGHRRTNRVGAAQRTMVPLARGERKVLDIDEYTIPLPCTWDDFSFNIRELAAAARVGAPLDTSHLENATRNVNESIEDQAINGLGFNVNGLTAPGVLAAPSANTYNFIDNESWTASGHSGEDILADVLAMIEEAQADKYFGPYLLLLGTGYNMKLAGDYKSATSGTIRQRLIEAMGPDTGSFEIITVDRMPADTVVLIQATSDVVDVVVGQQPAEVSWEHPTGWERYWVVMACLVTRFRDNYNGQSGVVIGTPS